jgi:hypothetical protein
MSHAAAPNIAAHHRVPGMAANATATTSFNWSGYADTATTAQTFTQVSASWVVPKVTCSPEDRIMSVWVGLDGATNGTVEQDGLGAQCFEGTAVYYTWYEMFPAGTVVIGTTVLPGDHISASVTRTGTSYKLTVTDATTSGNSGTTTKSCALTKCKDQSAEWIVERPAFSTTGIVPLAQYTKVTVTAASVTGAGTSGGITSFTPTDQITMADATSTYALETTSALSGAGTSFSSTWINSY